MSLFSRLLYGKVRYFVLLLFMVSVAQAETDCQALLAREPAAVAEAGAFFLHPRTVEDLKLQKLVAPVYSRFVNTAMAKDRLEQLLIQPRLDPEDIRARQEAVRELVDDADLRERVKAALVPFRKLNARTDGELNLVGDLNFLAGRQSSASAFLSVFSTALGTGILSATAASQIMQGTTQVTMQVGLTGIMLGSRNAMNQDKIRAPLYRLRHFVKNIGKQSRILRGAGSGYLQKIGRDFEAVTDLTHEESVVFGAKSLKRMIPSGFDTLASCFLLTNWGTQRTRKCVLSVRDNFEKLLVSFAELDLILNFAEMMLEKPDHYILPEILATGGETRLHIEGGHHPHVLAVNSASVANSVVLDEKTFLLLTGPNEGGKSTYLRMVATLTVLAQIGAPVPATEMSLVPVAVFTSMDVSDDLGNGSSRFRAQVAYIHELLVGAANEPHTLIVMDEVLNGTSPEEHTGIERGLIKYLVHGKSLGILATHDRKLQALEGEFPGVTNIHIDEEEEGSYHIRRGPSRRRNAVEVLEAVGLPQRDHRRSPQLS